MVVCEVNREGSFPRPSIQTLGVQVDGRRY